MDELVERVKARRLRFDWQFYPDFHRYLYDRKALAKKTDEGIATAIRNQEPTDGR